MCGKDAENCSGNTFGHDAWALGLGDGTDRLFGGLSDDRTASDRRIHWVLSRALDSQDHFAILQ